MKGRLWAAAPYALWLLLLASVVAWRKGVYFDGGVDQVVLGKAVLQIVALCLAFLAWAKAPKHQPLGGRSVFFLGFIVAISVIGALATDDIGASLTLSIRLFLLAATIVLILLVFPTGTVLKSLFIAMAVVGIIAALGGLPNIAAGERLAGGIPPMAPNGVAMMCGVPALAILHEILHGRGNKWLIGAFALLLGIVVATDSRTALAALFVALVVMVLYLRELKRSVAVGLVALLPFVFGIVAYTDMVESLVTREGGASSMVTLNSRTIAWQAVLDIPADTSEHWIGAGLSMKTVIVNGQYWDEQVLDSSWISALAQSGVVGTMALAAWCIFTIIYSLRASRMRSLTTALLTFILIRSFLENGLIESSDTFIVFFAIALLIEPVRPSCSTGTRRPERLKVPTTAELLQRS
jgi:O-antigen ligase